MNSSHRGPVTRNIFPFGDVIMLNCHKLLKAALQHLINVQLAVHQYHYDKYLNHQSGNINHQSHSILIFLSKHLTGHAEIIVCIIHYKIQALGMWSWWFLYKKWKKVWWFAHEIIWNDMFLIWGILKYSDIRVRYLSLYLNQWWLFIYNSAENILVWQNFRYFYLISWTTLHLKIPFVILLSFVLGKIRLSNEYAKCCMAHLRFDKVL